MTLEGVYLVLLAFRHTNCISRKTVSIRVGPGRVTARGRRYSIYVIQSDRAGKRAWRLGSFHWSVEGDGRERSVYIREIYLGS